MSTIRHVEVVIPANNEQGRIAACLRSVCAAAEHLAEHRPEVSCGITVVLDCCTDSTPAVVRGFGVHALSVQAGCVGTTRRTGITDAISRAALAGVVQQQLWIANTDADTVVDPTWLERQVALANSGLDAVIGTVTPMDVSPRVYQLWRKRYQLGENHHHVHGANLGFRAGVYSSAGGFRDIRSEEDVDLVARIQQVTTRWVATHQTTVQTSGRQLSRVQGGFASYVAALEAM
ncbi:MAG: glycosyltransferase [Mycobacterium sp.]